MSKPTPERLMKKELKRKAERKIMKHLNRSNPELGKLRKRLIRERVERDEVASRGGIV